MGGPDYREGKMGMLVGARARAFDSATVLAPIYQKL
jgi:hypothetical protein